MNTVLRSRQLERRTEFDRAELQRAAAAAASSQRRMFSVLSSFRSSSARSTQSARVALRTVDSDVIVVVTLDDSMCKKDLRGSSKHGT
jgi:hypothetical protein